MDLSQSANGRVSGKPWKLQKSATIRSHLQTGLKTKSWEDRVAQTKKAQAIKKIEMTLKDEKKAEKLRRIEIIKTRRKVAEERLRLEEDKAKMGARKAARLRRKAGRSKKVNG